jgi:(R,R)-butanediol dehydrogenase/meso-butanediol dehydrogenase/diacetyl reductase
MYEDPIQWDPASVMINEVEVRGSMCYAEGVYEAVIDLMAKGHYPTSGWVEHIAWDRLVEEGFVPLRRGERLKVLVDVGVPSR